MVENAQSHLVTQAAALLRGMVSSHNAVYGRGLMSSTVYDTAWVSMVVKQSQWLFPDSFRYVLETQADSGGWSTASPVIDRILCSLAALLALCRHRESPLQLGGLISLVEIQERIVKATDSLRTELGTWDVESTDRVGFEILVPSHLEQLSRFGIDVNFKDRDALLRTRHLKMSKFDVSILYGPRMCTALHSLEAFDGSRELDFDRIAHHKVCGGSMMASPSSTAAYLINCSVWDDEAEGYIRHAIANGHGKGNGSVPSAFPSTIFELTWVLSNLLEGGFEQAHLGAPQLAVVQSIIQKGLETGAGCLGFAAGLEPDADDTAMGITVLRMLGEPVTLEPLIKEYESELCFKTYTTERNSSFTANCNVLVALLNAEQPTTYTSQIEKTVRFLCQEWWRSTGRIEDKWNISIYYPTMLLTKALFKVMCSWNDGKLPDLPTNLIQEDISILLIQVLVQTLIAQNHDGSWGHQKSCEETAYATITLSQLEPILFDPPVRVQVNTALASGRRFLSGNLDIERDIELLWVEKVLYGSAVLSQCYILSALHSAFKRPGPEIGGFLCSGAALNSYKFYSRLPMFSETPEWRLKTALLQSSLFSTRIRRDPALCIFPREGMREEKYLSFIPLTWVAGAGHGLAQDVLSPAVSKAMMVMSALIYQADEFMEQVVASLPDESFNQVGEVIRFIFADNDHGPSTPPESIESIKSTLMKFVNYTLHHPLIVKASTYDRRQLRSNLQEFLLGHLRQASDNRQLLSSRSAGERKPVTASMEGSLFAWVRSVGANHTGGPFAFSFLLCLMGSGRPVFSSAVLNYVAEDVSRHVSTLCRLYNDFGSVTRDRNEGNLNCVDFSELSGAREGDGDGALKQQLMDVAEYERTCLDSSLNRLREGAGEEIWGVVKAFCDVTNLYGEMYILKDLTPGLKRKRVPRGV